MAKVNLAQELKDFDGKALHNDLTVQRLLGFMNEEILPLVPQERQAEIGEKIGKLAAPLTLKRLIFTVLGTGLQGFSGEDMWKLYQIGNTASSADEIDLESEQIVLLRRAVETVCKSPIYVGQARAMLEGKA